MGVYNPGSNSNEMKFMQLSNQDWIVNGGGSFAYTLIGNTILFQRQSTAVGLQTGNMRQGFKAPPQIISIPANAFSINTFASNIATSTMTATLYINGVADTIINGVSILPTVINVLQTKTFSIGSPIPAGATLMLEIVNSSNSNGQSYRISLPEIKYI